MTSTIKKNTAARSFTTRLDGAVKHYAFYPLLPFLIIIFIFLSLANKLFNLQFSTSDNGRIGGILNLYWYLADIEKNSKERKLIIFFNPSTGSPANKQWDVMLKKKIFNFSSPLFFHYTQRLIKIFGGMGSNLLYKLPGNVFHNKRVITAIQNLKTPIMSLTPEECALGVQILEAHGIKKDEKIICIHNRDSAFLNAANPNANWAYHDYRDSSIYNYLKTAEVFSSKGYRPVRIGSITLEKLDKNLKSCVDYANSGWQSDFLDIYLAQRSVLFLCSDTGISVPPEIFLKPMVYVNWTLLPRMTNWVQFGVFIAKKIFSKELNRLLTFKEIINNPDFISPHQKINWEVFNLIENTPDEILEATLEMEMRISNTWTESEEDSELQKQFWSLYPESYIRPKRLYMGAHFLRENKYLLS